MPLWGGRSWLALAPSSRRAHFALSRKRWIPRQLNGGIFLGLNGIVVKSHGGTDATGFASAVDLAYEMASSGVVKRLGSDLDHFHTKLELEGAA